MNAYGEHIKRIVKLNFFQQKEVLETSKFLARLNRLNQRRAGEIEIKIDEEQKKVEIRIDNNEIKLIIRCIDRQVKICMGREDQTYWEKGQDGDEIMARDIMVNMLRFLTNNVRFNVFRIFSDCETILPTWNHIAFLRFITRDIIFVRNGIRWVQDRIYYRWMQYFVHGYNAPLTRNLVVEVPDAQDGGRAAEPAQVHEFLQQ